MSILATIDVSLDDSDYPIYIGRGIIKDIAAHIDSSSGNSSCVLVYDEFFEDSIVRDVEASLSAQDRPVIKYAMTAGKGNKTIYETLKIYALLEENNIARDATLIAIGGGVVGDLAGFVASTWLRGMKLVHIPTTMLAMVDSSIGGKTAVNFRNTINGIGSYYHPIFNLIDLDLVDSLSDRDYCSGLAEVIKCAIICDREFFDYLDRESISILSRKSDFVAYCIERTIQIKIQHVQGDVREGGKRLLLNYGHTLGHSIEVSTVKNGDEQLRHGEGVSLGMMAVAYIAMKHLNLPDSIYEEMRNILAKYHLPVLLSASSLGFDRNSLLLMCKQNVLKDKKRLNNNLRLILADRIGSASVRADVPTKLIENAFNHIVQE